MYKLLVLFVFFSLVLTAQVNEPLKNSNNNVSSPELEKKSNREVKVQSSVNAKEVHSQIEVFEINVNQLQSELKTISLSSQRKSPTPFQQQQMEVKLREIGRINENSFEFNLLNYKVGNYDFSKIKSLKAAENLKPNDANVMKEFTAYSYIMNDEKELVKYLKRLNTQRIFSKDLEIYASNVLQSLPLLTVLITHGENDTYPLLIQQKIKISRQDVEIISLDHLQSKDYRKALKTKGFKIPNSDIIDTDFYKEFVELNSSKNIITSGSVPQTYLKKGKQLNTVGLGFSFEKGNADDYNIELYEGKMKSLINNHVKSAKDGQVLNNYLPFLFSVRNGYISIGDDKELAEVEAMIMNIGQKSNKSKQINLLLNK